MRRTFAVARFSAAAVGVAALVAHLDYSLGSGASALPNFFSYFTMQSAIAAVILWPIGGIVALRRAIDPPALVTARALITTYQIVSGVVYTVIVTESLSHGISIQVPVSSQILHYLLPAYALVDWLFAPGRPRAHWRILAGTLVFPLVWGGFTMVRGAIVGWYPYFFLDPYQVAGPGEFATYSAIVLAFILVVAAILTAASRFLPPSASRQPVSPVEERYETPAHTGGELVVAHAGERGGGRAPDEADQHG